MGTCLALITIMSLFNSWLIDLFKVSCLSWAQHRLARISDDRCLNSKTGHQIVWICFFCPTLYIHSLPSVVTTEPPLLMDASECDGRICPVPAAPFPPPTESRWSLRRWRWRRNRLRRRNEPELRTPAILLKSAARDPATAAESVMSQVLRRRLASSSTLYIT